jgi:DNA-binding NarL/FixJ family response regulator
VPRPAWYQPQRKHKFSPRINRPPSRRREQIRKYMEQGLKLAEIADELKVTRTFTTWTN